MESTPAGNRVLPQGTAGSSPASSATSDYWFSTGWACGLVRTDSNGRIIPGGAPIFNKLVGQLLADVVRKGKYRHEKLEPI